MDRKTKTWVNVVIGVALILLIGWFVKSLPCPSSAEYIYFKIVLAAAVTCLSALFLGTLQIENKLLKAGGPFAVFILLLKFTPQLINTENKCLPDFSFSINLRNTDQTTIEGLSGRVSILINNHYSQERKIDERGRVSFEDIPVTYIDTAKNSAIVELKSDGYWFESNHKKAINVDITGKSVTLLISEDDSRSFVSGTVKDPDATKVVPDAVISLTGSPVTTKSDVNGYFKLKVPKEMRNQTMILKVIKSGYELNTQEVTTIAENEINLIPN